jgi:hypothetical protein
MLFLRAVAYRIMDRTRSDGTSKELEIIEINTIIKIRAENVQKKDGRNMLPSSSGI